MQNFGAFAFGRSVQTSQRMYIFTDDEAAKNLGITSKMLRDWIRQEEKIASLKKGTRKGIDGRRVQEESMEEELFREFQEGKVADGAVDRDWFYRHARRIYAKQYLE